MFLARVGLHSGDRDLADLAVRHLIGKPVADGNFEDGVELVIWHMQVPKPWKTLEAFIVNIATHSELADWDEVNIFRAEFHYLILRRIRADWTGQPYWEVNFRRAVKNSVGAVWTALKPKKSRPGRTHVVNTVPAERLVHSTMSPDRIFETNEAALALDKALRTLPEDQRHVIEELYLPDSEDGPPTQEELAAELGVDARTIRYRRDRGCSKLRALLGDDRYEWLRKEEPPYVVSEQPGRDMNASSEETP